MVMNKCKIVQDLLPLYADNLCSPETKEFVEEHLKECEDCQTYFEEMAQEIVPKLTYDTICAETKETIEFIKHILIWPPGDEEDSEPISETIRSELKETTEFMRQIFEKTKRHKLEKRLTIAVLIITLFFAIFIPLTCISWVTVPTSEIRVTLKSSSDDGPFTFSLDVLNNNYKDIKYFFPEEDENEILYITLKRPLLTLPFKRKPQPDFLRNWTFDPQMGTEGTLDKVYVGTPEDRILIWEHK